MKITLEFLENHDACREGIKFFKEKFGEETDHKILRKKLIKIERYNWLYWGISKILTNNNCVKFAIYCAELVLHIYEGTYPADDRPRNAIKAAQKYVDNPTKENSVAAWDAARDAAWATRDAEATSRAAYRAANRAAWAARATEATEAVDAANRAANRAAWAARVAWAAAVASRDARDARDARDVARDAARDAARSVVKAAAWAAEAAAVASREAWSADAAEAAADAAADAACDAANTIKTKIINYGLKLIEEQEATQ